MNVLEIFGLVFLGLLSVVALLFVAFFVMRGIRFFQEWRYQKGNTQAKPDELRGKMIDIQINCPDEQTRNIARDAVNRSW